jgi:tetratricopeptide (TPR) repeat protein
LASTFAKSILTALMAVSAPVLAQQVPDAPPPEAPPIEEAAPAAETPVARELTSAEIAAFNKAVTDFTAGQTAQQKGDNATAVAKYDAALPAIRVAAQADPSKIDNLNFLANALYAQAAAYGALGQMDRVIPIYDESVPYWRKVVEAKPTDIASRNILAGILIQLGNQNLRDHDRGGADPFFEEALKLARQTVTDQPGDAASKNILLAALVGASQTGTEEGIRDEAISMGQAMIADGTIDAVNKPQIDTMTGAPATEG